MNDVAECIGCKCTDIRACETSQGPCSWIVVDYEKGIGVCSECSAHINEYHKKIEGEEL